jgi:predicted transcriptional regulator
MMHTDCMIKLLRHGALTRRECIEITGWSRNVLRRVLDHLYQSGRIKHEGFRGGRYYLGNNK